MLLYSTSAHKPYNELTDTVGHNATRPFTLTRDMMNREILHDISVCHRVGKLHKIWLKMLKLLLPFGTCYRQKCVITPVCMYSYQPEGWLDPHTVLPPDARTHT